MHGIHRVHGTYSEMLILTGKYLLFHTPSTYSLCFVLVRPTFFVYTPPARYSLPGTSISNLRGHAMSASEGMWFVDKKS